jgi:hypothetical protein
MDRKKLAICTIFENQARLLPEWLAYHHLVGVDHFVLYDNGSTDESAQAIHGSPVAEHATLIRWPQRPGRTPAYRHFIDIFAPSFEWVAFLDVDQFLVPLNNPRVVDTLDWLSNAAAVLVHRRMFRPNDWPPGNLAIEAFGRRAGDAFPANRAVRMIARCSELLDVTSQMHEFRVNGPVFNTAGHLAPSRAVLDQPCFLNLVINQYDVRTDAGASAPGAAGTDDARPAGARAAGEDQYDDAIMAFAPAVRQLLRMEPTPPATPEPLGFDAAAAAEPMILDALPADPAPPEAAAGPWAEHAEIEVAPGWNAVGPDGQVRAGGLALVFRDRSRPGEPWLAALRGAAADGIDPAFLTDEYDHIQDFASDTAARAACDTALAQGR